MALFTPERKAVRDAKGNLLVQPEQGHIYAWDTFRAKVLTEKVGCLQSFFGKDNAEHGNAMLYIFWHCCGKQKTTASTLHGTLTC